MFRNWKITIGGERRIFWTIERWCSPPNYQIIIIYRAIFPYAVTTNVVQRFQSYSIHKLISPRIQDSLIRYRNNSRGIILFFFSSSALLEYFRKDEKAGGGGTETKWITKREWRSARREAGNACCTRMKRADPLARFRLTRLTGEEIIFLNCHLSFIASLRSSGVVSSSFFLAPRPFHLYPQCLLTCFHLSLQGSTCRGVNPSMGTRSRPRQIHGDVRPS